MSKNVKATAPKVVPFFARFLEEQAAKSNSSNTPWAETKKYPSDWEEW
jgi:Serine endopeptidase inhibitors